MIPLRVFPSTFCGMLALTHRVSPDWDQSGPPFKRPLGPDCSSDTDFKAPWRFAAGGQPNRVAVRLTQKPCSAPPRHGTDAELQLAPVRAGHPLGDRQTQIHS